MSTKDAVNHLTRKLRRDESFRETWRANIAMSYIDVENSYKRKTGKKVLNQEDRHKVANDAAERFLKLLCGQRE